MRRAAAKFLRNTMGAAALEFAFVSPLLFASVLGTFETGRVIYQQNHLSAAVAAGARSVTLNGGADEAAIEAAIRAKYHAADQSRVVISQTQATIAGQTFKKISATYNHQLLVKYGSGFSGFTLTATRYAPDL